MEKISAEAAKLVRDITPIIGPAKPVCVQRALTDILGVMTAHVLDNAGLTGAERDEMLEESLQLMRDEIKASYTGYMKWAQWPKTANAKSRSCHRGSKRSRSQ